MCPVGRDLAEHFEIGLLHALVDPAERHIQFFGQSALAEVRICGVLLVRIRGLLDEIALGATELRESAPSSLSTAAILSGESPSFSLFIAFRTKSYLNLRKKRDGEERNLLPPSPSWIFSRSKRITTRVGFPQDKTHRHPR